MNGTSKNTNLIRFITFCTVVVLMFSSIILAAETDANCLTPYSNQYFELKAKDLKDVVGQNKQIILELWGHNMKFKGFDVRLSFDDTKLKPSNIITNQLTNDSTEFFKWESEFEGSMDFFTIDYDGVGTGIRAIVSLEPDATESAHIIDEDRIGMQVQTGNSVLLGKLSFQMTADDYDETWLSLEESAQMSPTTGIKINIDGTYNYQSKSTMKFTKDFLSDNTYLEDIVLSTGEKNADPSLSTYREFDYTPTFDKEIHEYEYSLQEMLEEIDVTVTKSEEHSTLKAVVPKRNAEGELEYDVDGITLLYEEKDVESDIPFSVTLNELGKGDTVITIKVIAQDPRFVDEYKITIKRPYGMIKGQLQLGSNLRDSIFGTYGTTVKYNADAILYESNQFNWDGVVTGAANLADTDTMDKKAQTVSDDEGNFTLYVIPGSYDMKLERLGFLPYVLKNIDIHDGTEIDLTTKGSIVLVDGDANRDGIIGLEDMVEIVIYSGVTEQDPGYDYKYDFGQKGFIGLEDMVSATTNSRQTINIEEF